MVSQFCGLEVCIQGFDRAVFPLDLEGRPSSPLPTSSGLRAICDVPWPMEASPTPSIFTWQCLSLFLSLPGHYLKVSEARSYKNKYLFYFYGEESRAFRGGESAPVCHSHHRSLLPLFSCHLVLGFEILTCKL